MGSFWVLSDCKVVVAWYSHARNQCSAIIYDYYYSKMYKNEHAYYDLIEVEKQIFVCMWYLLNTYVPSFIFEKYN